MASKGQNLIRFIEGEFSHLQGACHIDWDILERHHGFLSVAMASFSLSSFPYRHSIPLPTLTVGPC